MMEAVTATHAYVEYQPVSKRLARRFGPRSGMLDAKARTREDFTHELRLKAIDAAEFFQRRVGFCLPAERRYIYKALWNLSRNWRRDQHRQKLFEVVVDSHEETALGVYEIAGQIEARDVLRTLIDALPARDQEVLGRLAAAKGVISEAWDPSRDGPLWRFERQVSRIRNRAKRVAYVE